MSKEKKDKHFIKKPVYPGGTKAYNAFIRDNLKYPEEALKNKTEGVVYLKYDVDYTGKVSDVKVIRSLGDGCDEEAVRVIKLLKFEIPKGPRKLRVLFHKEAKIKFKIQTKKKKTQDTSVQSQFTITHTKKEKQKNSKDNNKSSGSYNYTIEW